MADSIIIIIDCSKSSEEYLKSYVVTVNNILKNTHPDTLVSIILINNSIEYLCLNSLENRSISINDISPNGTLFLYDKFTAVINILLNFYIINKQKPPTVILLCDNEDTSSRFTNIKLMALQIAIAKSCGWRFICLGLIEDSVNLGRYIECDTNILYNATEQCQKDLVDVLGNLLGNKIIQQMADSLSNVKIN
jgi:hypothetical protein